MTIGRPPDPPIREPFTDEAGRILPVWVRWIRSAYLWTGEGATGHVDDGTNFRITITNGLVTAIGDSVSGGHS